MLEFGELEVTTRSDVPLDGAQDSLKSARANWQIDLTNCIVDPTFTAPITGAGVTWMQCGPHRFDLKYAAGRYFLHPWGQVKKQMEPHLTD